MKKKGDVSSYRKNTQFSNREHNIFPPFLMSFPLKKDITSHSKPVVEYLSLFDTH